MSRNNRELHTNSCSNTFSLRVIQQFRGPGSKIDIVTDYGLDGLWIEFQWGRDFSYLSRLALGPTQPPVQWVLGLSQG